MRRSQIGSSRVGLRMAGQQRENRIGVARGAQLCGERGIAQDAGDARQGFQVVSPGVFGREQHENQINRRAVQRLKINRPVEPCENAVYPRGFRQLGMRDGDAIANAGRPEFFSLPYRVEYFAVGQTGHPGGAFAYILQSLFLGNGFQRWQYRLGANQIGQWHGMLNPDRRRVRLWPGQYWYRLSSNAVLACSVSIGGNR